MNVLTWSESKTRQFTWFDFAIFKIYIASAVLFLAKLWPGILSLGWYWYAIVFVLSGIWIISKMFKK